MSKIACVRRGRNEGDIIEAVRRHVSALFDEMVLLDHAPVDGTRESVEALSQRDRLVRLYDFIAPAYELNGAVSFQSPASSLQRRKISDLADSFGDQRLTVG